MPRVPLHRPQEKPVSHEMACGNDSIQKNLVDMATDVRNLVPKIDIATVT